MKVRFTKTTPTHHLFEIVRNDGSREEALIETKSFMPHDLIHLAYESTAGLKESFFGKLASGTTFAEFGDRQLMAIVREHYRALSGQWRSLPHHVTMEIDWC